MNLQSFLKPIALHPWLPLALAILVSSCATEKKLTPEQRLAREERLTGAAKKYQAWKDGSELAPVALAPGSLSPEIDMGPPWGKWKVSELKKKVKELEARKRQQSQEGEDQQSPSQQ
ncbi:MAG: hypothetical protein ABJF10_12070 [Chthoniobacter sp.]|uniref:hypothetical protein n=1 Tax=Chthoniobacter sp. TaxID=2510640 RepID=UPI0032A686A0